MQPELQLLTGDYFKLKNKTGVRAKEMVAGRLIDIGGTAGAAQAIRSPTS